MNTASRATAIAHAASPLEHWIGSTQADDLLAWVEAELGNASALDSWVPYGTGLTRAIAPPTILHVLSGNTPHAALQSIIGGLLLGSNNLLKLPSAGLPAASDFISRLPDKLQRMVVTSDTLHDDWIVRADAVIVYGSDETIDALKKRTPSGKIFIGHGHKVSLGVVWKDESFASCAAAARDVSLFNQQGCLSPHAFYVRESRPGFARDYAKHLAEEMDRVTRQHPPDPLDLEEITHISNLRAAYRFRAADDLRVEIWESKSSMDWTVIYEDDAWFPATCGNRVVFVKPLPDDLAQAMGPMADFIGAVGLYPCTTALANRFAGLSPSRFCAIGAMQDPPWIWHNGGIMRLASLVKWVDFESKGGLTN